MCRKLTARYSRAGDLRDAMSDEIDFKKEAKVVPSPQLLEPRKPRKLPH